MTKFAGNDAVASALGKVKLEDAVLTDDEEIEAGKDDTSTEGTEKAVVDVPEAEEVCAVVWVFVEMIICVLPVLIVPSGLEIVAATAVLIVCVGPALLGKVSKTYYGNQDPLA